MVDSTLLLVLRGAPYGNQNAAGPHDMSADEWEQRRAEYSKSLTPQQRMVLSSYSDDMSSSVNTLLRVGKATKINAKQAVRHMMEALRPIDRDVTVYRFRRVYPVYTSQYSDTELKPGVTFKDRGFVSTTVDPEQYGPIYAKEATTVMKIHVPKGTPVAYGMWNPKQGYPEKEIILPPWSHFKVTGEGEFSLPHNAYRDNYTGLKRYDLEYIPTKHGK